MDQPFSNYNTNTIETDYNSSITQLLDMLAEEAGYQEMRRIISDSDWGNAIINPPLYINVSKRAVSTAIQHVVN